MSYQALYRKYRPTDFSDVIGQFNIVKTLQNSLKLNKISHAYLFSGPRGTGKTTLAKILAKNINCLDLNEGKSCGKCKNCLSIINNECSDIIEIDAASNNGVEEIREIRNNVNLVPTQLKYKVYIIDEVHMLSIGAFNGLLKSLEEPPSHVIFILATTDLHKVPITIVSRCQCFEFKKIKNEDIVDRLKLIVDEEKIEIDENVLMKIAKNSDGGMRDSLSLLDKIRAYTNEKITLDDFYEVNGSMKSEIIDEFVTAIKNKDIKKILNLSTLINDSGKDYIIFSQDILEELRDRIVSHYIEKKDEDIEFLLRFVNDFNIIVSELKKSSNVRIMFEVSILSLLENNVDKEKINSIQVIKNDNLKQKEEFNKVKIQDINKNLQVKSEVIIEKDDIIENSNFNSYYDIRSIIINNAFVTANKKYLLDVKNNWYLINDYVLDSDLSTVASYLKDVEVRVVGEKEMIISCDYDSLLERGINFINKIEKILELVYNTKYKVGIVTTNEWEKEKQKYIDSKKNGINYTYQEISDFTKKSENKIINNSSTSSIVKEAIDIFGEDLVTVK